jgi:hypothetical protein
MEWPGPEDIPECVRIFAFETSNIDQDASQQFEWPVVAEGKSAWAHVDSDSKASEQHSSSRAGPTQS